jgi:hypothetical protein
VSARPTPARIGLTLVSLTLAACAAPASREMPGPASPADAAVAPLPAPQEAFWAELRRLCGRAFAGRLVAGNASDSTFARAALVMHVRECAPAEIRIPFHADANRSRTWVVTRTAGGLRLKHDHRHEDGSEDTVTQYGGDSRGPGTAERQEFPADAHTAALLPAARTNVWTLELLPGTLFAYALRREGTDRHFRVEFDLARPVPAPPPPWGARP